ncbi:hypothetical protein ACEWY4_022169 [Coilia grayii]|uniref:Calponin-homology (CH) domain-containing protein n=1 Tax=Coilia grayii TaxID=363190 RepID=A0ABD1J6R8_9TELE
MESCLFLPVPALCLCVLREIKAHLHTLLWVGLVFSPLPSVCMDHSSLSTVGVHIFILTEAREAIQKRTFTRWINIHLKACEPALEVNDLFSDAQDGHVFMALMEQLSGYKMLYRFRPSTHRLFRLNNIAKVLNFLEDRNLKCKSIDASDVADGVPSAVLGLVWTIIVLFHIKKHTRNIQYIVSTHSGRSIDTNTDTLPISSSAKSSDWDSNTFPSKRKKSSATSKYRGTAIKTLLRWVQTCTSKYDVEVRDFGKSWRSGLAFLALIKSISPAVVDMRSALSKTPRENVEDAFHIAQSTLGIPPLLDLEDVITATPDEQCVITYVTHFLECRQKLDELQVNGLEPYTRCYGPSTSFPDVSCSPLSAPDHHPSVIEPTLFTPVKDIHSPLPNDVFGTSSTKGKDFGNAFSVINTTGKACADILSDIETLSLSSEEGVYTLSPLDSEEEEAYSYILALDEEVNGNPRPDFQGLPVISGIEHHSTLCTCQYREQANSKNEFITGHEQITLAEPNGDTALGKKQHENTNHDTSFLANSLENDYGQNISPELVKARDTTSDTKCVQGVECSNVDTHTKEEMSPRREDVPSGPSDSEMEESLSPDSDSGLGPHDPTEDSLDPEDLSHSNVCKAKDDVDDHKTAVWMESHQIDNGRFNDKTDGDSKLTRQTQEDSSLEEEAVRRKDSYDTVRDTGHMPQTPVGCSVEREEEAMKETDMCDIPGVNGRLPQSAIRTVPGAENGEELTEWNKCSLLSDEDIAQVNADTRERKLSSGSMECCGVLDTGEFHLLIILWLFTYCFFIIHHGICTYFSDLLK